MKIAFFDTRAYEKEAFLISNADFNHEINFLEYRLDASTASLAAGYECVCAFVNADLKAETLNILHQGGTRIIAMRCAGFNNVDIETAKKLGMKVVRVPEYSPNAIAEHVVALIQTLNRKTHRAYNRVRESNFSLVGLTGFDLNEKTVGIVGVGKIGKVFAKIMTGFGCKVLMYDINQDQAFAKSINAEYVTLERIYKESNIISLHVPLTPDTKYLIRKETINQMIKGVMIINTGRGALINSKDLIDALKSGHVGHAGLDVYEEEENIFFKDLSEKILDDDVLARLLTFPNVLVTGHQAFLTNEALHGIASTTLSNVAEYESGNNFKNSVF